MKKLLKSRKVKRLLRSVFCVTLIITTTICAPLQMVFGDGGTQTGMKWTRVYSQVQMEKYFGATNDKSLNSVNDWKRCLIITPNGKYYVGNTGVKEYDDYENLSLVQITGTMGIKAGAESFITRTDLGATSIKYVSYDDEHYGNKYYIRTNGTTNSDTTTGLDDKCIGINLSWYGVAWHAAATSEFVAASVSDPGSSSFEHSCACSASVRTEWTFSFGPTRKYEGVEFTTRQMTALSASAAYHDGGWWHRPKYINGNYTKKSYPYYMTSVMGEKDSNVGKLRMTSDATSVFHEGFPADYYTLKQGGNATVKTDYFIKESYFEKYVIPFVRSYYYGNEDVNEFCAMITYNTGTKNVHDRTWNYKSDDDGTRIDLCKSEGSSSKISFMIYYGEPTAMSMTVEDTPLLPYQSAVFSDHTINNSVQITVGKGATLSIEGVCYNNGRIVVDGGTLVINGCLDSDPNQATGVYKLGTSSDYYRPGDIVITNGGVLIVSKGASLLHRNAGAEITVANSSYVRNEGLMCIATSLVLLDHSELRSEPGSFILIGAVPLITKGAEDYDMDYLKENKGKYLDSLVGKVTSDDAKKADGSSLKPLNYIGLNVYGKSSYINYGGTFIYYPYNQSDSYIRGRFSKNIYSSIESMIENW